MSKQTLINDHGKLQKNTIRFGIKKIQHNALTSRWKKLLRTSEASEVLINKQISIINDHIKLKKIPLGSEKKTHTNLRRNERAKKGYDEWAKRVKFLSLNEYQKWMVTYYWKNHHWFQNKRNTLRHKERVKKSVYERAKWVCINKQISILN